MNGWQKKKTLKVVQPLCLFASVLIALQLPPPPSSSYWLVIDDGSDRLDDIDSRLYGLVHRGLNIRTGGDRGVVLPQTYTEKGSS